MSEIIFTEERTFRRTPGVHFADIGVPGSNGIDLVEHAGPSVSPPSLNEEPQWYIHAHQCDNNRCIKGHRLFELFNPGWVDKHWYVLLDEDTGALQIPPGTYHRSYSGNDGSLLINHAMRDELYDESTEFIPVACPEAAKHPANYHGIGFYDVEHFIKYGELLTCA